MESNPYAQYLPHIDVKDGLTRIMNNKKMYLSLLGRFKVRQMTEDLLDKIINKSEPLQVTQAAHAIKGAAGNLGLTALKNISTEIEMRGKDGVDCTDLVGLLTESLEATEQAIAALLEQERK